MSSLKMSSLVQYPKTFGDGILVEWEETPSCYFSTAPQGSPLWDALHTGAMSSSRVSDYLGYSQFSSGDPNEAAMSCVGLTKKSFNSAQMQDTHIGITGEPLVRDFYSKHIGIPIKEVGIAVWKKDPRFRSSLDGMYVNAEGKLCGIEIKISKRVYPRLIAYYKQKVKKPDHTHIFDSHYNQMVQSMHIIGLEYIDYVVCGYNEGNTYVERVYPNPAYFENVIYKPGVHFLDTYVTPLMLERGIKRIDPPPNPSAVDVSSPGTTR